VASEYAYTDRADSGSAFTFATAGATAYATFGLLKAKASVIAGTGGELGGDNAGGVANNTVRWSDSLAVVSPGRNGQNGTVVCRMEVSGGLVASSVGSGSRGLAGATINVRGTSYNLMVSSVSELPSESGSIPSVIEFNLPVVFGANAWQPISFSLYTYASASAPNVFGGSRGGQGVSDYGDFGSSLAWGGIVEVRDAAGVPVTDWVALSGSGFDYSRSYALQVPEPGAGSQLRAGGAALWALHRRRLTSRSVVIE
jgi:hypothetical protein